METNETKEKVQGTIQEANLDYLPIWLDAFLKDRKSQNLSAKTVSFYKEKLANFMGYCDSRLVKNVSQVTPTFIREYLLWLEEGGHTAGGIHCHFRSLKCFLNWYWLEVEPDGKNPIQKVKAPRVEQEAIEGVTQEDFQALLHECTNKRDYALLCFMLDTGCRASEILTLKMEDCNLATGAVLIRKTKSKKARYVYLGRKSRIALRRYVREWGNSEFVFHTKGGDCLTYWGLRATIERLAKKAGLENMPSPHDFRRAFALEMLRNGADVFSLQNLMGHSSLQILRVYLRQTDEDMHNAHILASPVDRAKRNG